MIAPILENKVHNKALLLWNIFLGKIHIVGSSLTQSNNAPYSVKPGIMGYAQIHQTRIWRNRHRQLFTVLFTKLFILVRYRHYGEIDIFNYSVLEHLEKASKN